jgi:hypothetical protein
MYPKLEDRANYTYPNGGLLQVSGIVVGDEELRGKELLVVKNGLTTGTTVGHTNGLHSITRSGEENYGIEHTAHELGILSNQPGPFSAPGDSGAIIIDRAGRIVALLTGGGSGHDKVDVTYGTPYWWLEEQIKNVFPDCQLFF